MLPLLAWLPVAPAQGPRLPAGDLEGVPARADVVERHGITWRFAQPARVGLFVNGDPWVIGPVDVIGITPQSIEVADRVMHGSMLDPDPSSMVHGYDSALLSVDGGIRFDLHRNVAFGIGPARPLRLSPGQSLVSTESLPEPHRLPQIKTAAVLTVLAEAPPPDAFRPPYVRADKAVRHRLAHVDWSRLQRLRPAAGAPRVADVAAALGRLWLDHLPSWEVRYLHPRENMPDHARDMAALLGTAGLLLNLDLPSRDKQALLVPLLQIGIDNHAALRGGGAWPGRGGHGSGRKFPILVAGALLRDPQMLAIGAEFGSRCSGGDGGVQYFAEDGQTFFVAETTAGVWNWGHGGYTREHQGLAEWGFAHASHPNLDTVAWSEQNPYRICCTANAWVGQVLAVRILGLVEQWNHPPLFAYLDRYQGFEHQEPWHRALAPWHAAMWDAYRARF